MCKYNLIFLFLLVIPILNAQNVIINEICSQGCASKIDFEGEHSDWIELYNAGSDTVLLASLYLSDNKANPQKYHFKTGVILPNSFLVVFASGNDTVVNNEIHTNFKIDNDGEQIILTNIQNNSLCVVNVPELNYGESWGRVDSSLTEYKVFDLPTPSSSNSISSNIHFSKTGGFFKENFTLQIESDSDDEIRYTTNGKDPDIHSTLFPDSLIISIRKNNILSTIPTTPLSGKNYINNFIWKLPETERNTGTVIKCRSFRNGVPSSKIYTQSYIIDNKIEELLEFPVISIVTDSVNLFDYEKGIYIPGATFDNTEWIAYWPSGNYHKPWSKLVNIEYFEPTGFSVCNSPVMMEIKGGGSACLPQKSFKIRFYPDKGLDKLSYTLFPTQAIDTYKSFVLRNGGNDFMHTHFLDAFLHNLIKNTGIETQASLPCHAYINGEYWGVFNIRETFDKSYFKYHFGVDEDSLIIVSYCGIKEYGSNAEYHELINFIESNPVSEKQNYEYLCSKIDIENCIDYYISEIFVANYDWPGNNYMMWKTTNPNSKWRWGIYDLDFSWAFDKRMDYTKNSFLHATRAGETGWPAPDCSTFLFRSLITNKDFNTQFVERFVYHLKNTFSSESVLHQIDSFANIYDNQIEHQIDRWGYPQDYSFWLEWVEKLREFARYRPCYIKQYMMEFFDLESLDFECEYTGIEVIGKNEGISVVYENKQIEVKSPDIIWSVAVFNILGQKICSLPVSNEALQITYTPESSFPDVFIVTVTTEMGVYSKKMVLK